MKKYPGNIITFILLIAISSWAPASLAAQNDANTGLARTHIQCENLLQPVTLQQVEEFLSEIAYTRDASNIGKAIVQILLQLRQLNMRHIEEILRNLQHPSVHLVAVSLENAIASGATPSDYIAMDIPTKARMPFYLWIGTNGPAEAFEFMQAHDLDPAQNLLNLENTGMLVRGAPARLGD